MLLNLLYLLGVAVVFVLLWLLFEECLDRSVEK